MSDREHLRCQDSHSPVPANKLSSLSPSRAAEGPCEGLFVSSLPSLQTWVSHKHKEAPVPARQWEHLHTGLELNLPTGDIWLFNRLRHKMKP